MATNEKQNYGQILSDAASAFVADGDVAALQNVYRAIPAPARGNAQTVALLAHPDSMAAMLDAFNSLPPAESNRVRPQLSDAEKTAVRARIVDRLLLLVNNADGTAWNDNASDLYRETFTATVEKVIDYVNGLSVGGRGHTTYDAKLTDIAPVGTVLTANGRDDVVTIESDDAVTYNGETMSASAAAGKVLGRPQNGWTFWRHNGSTLATLRDRSDA